MEVPWIEPRAIEVIRSGESHNGLQIELGGVPRGAAIVVSGGGGLDRDCASIMNQLAEHGYESIAVEGAEVRPSDDPDASLIRIAMALDRLAERGWQTEQIGIVGFDGGAANAAAAASAWRLGAAVSVALGADAEPAGDRGAEFLLSMSGAAQTVRTPWLGLLRQAQSGATDGAIVRATEVLADRAPVHTDVVVYPLSDGRISLDSADVRSHAVAWDSWQRTAEWFDRQVVPRPTPLAERWRAIAHALSA